MVVLRESPRKPGKGSLTPPAASSDTTAAPQPDQPWPPRSPLDALLSSPSGRKKYERRRALSPSPTPGGTRRAARDVEDDEEDDEETLQLKLQAIEAKLKLKKLQRAKAKSGTDYLDGGFETPHRAESRSTVREWARTSPKPQSNVQVPLSPLKQRTAGEESTSPARVLLGIDKGLKAHNVSLKRAASSKAATFRSDASISRSQSTPTVDTSIKGFGARMAESRVAENEETTKKQRIVAARSKGFNLPASVTKAADQRTDDDKKQSGDGAPTLEPYSGFHLSKQKLDHNALTRALRGKDIYSLPRLLKEVHSPKYEPPDCESDFVVVAIVASKSAPLEKRTVAAKVAVGGGGEEATRHKFMALRLTDLKWELDLFLFDTGFEHFWRGLAPGTAVAILNPGIMPPKAVPRGGKGDARDTGAFSLRLSSSEDTVLEIGAAAHMGFCSAMKLDGHECGTWVDARKTEICEFHMNLRVNKARAGRMEFNGMHGLSGPGAGGRGRGRGRGRGGGGSGGKSGLLPEGRTYVASLHETLYFAPRGRGGGAAALLDADDALTNDPDAWQRGCSREEWARRRKKAQDREAELARRLGELGGGAGGDYMRAASAAARTPASGPASASRGPTPREGSASAASAPAREARDARSLGLLGKSAADVDMSPTAAGPSSSSGPGGKRKRPATGSLSEPMGWGGAYKRGLLLSPPPQAAAKSAVRRVDGEASPKKRARIMVPEKGIREPGRESLPAGRQLVVDDDEDDDLEII
jgi:minichromosome maintenance protein 10